MKYMVNLNGDVFFFDKSDINTFLKMGYIKDGEGLHKRIFGWDQEDSSMGTIDIDISKDYDEWYIVSIFSFISSKMKTYRCDQMEGVLKLLDDLKIK